MTETKEIAPYEGQRPIIMKSGLTLWVSEETARKIEEHISKQNAHGFIKIKENNQTINTSEVEGVYTVEQYKDLCRVKQGEWQCAYKKWHGRKEVCECEKEARINAQREKERQARQKENDRPEPTEAEKKEHRDRLERINEESVLKGNNFMRELYAKGNKTGRAIRRSTIEAWEKVHGPVSAEILGSVQIREDIEEAHKAEVAEVIT